MPDTALTFEYKPSVRGQTILTAKLGAKVIHTDKLDISRADRRKDYIAAMGKGRRGIAKYCKDAAAELDRIAAELAAPTKGGGDDGQTEQGFVPYIRTKDGLYRIKKTESGVIPTQLTNFDARIIADIVRDDGAETQNSLEIEAKLGGNVQQFTVPASAFPGMNWAIEYLGSKAIVYAGSTIKDHARTAIQMLSTEHKRLVIYTHIGWRKIDGQWVYLHAGGGIGPDGSVPSVSVDLGDGLSLYRLSDPPQGRALTEAVAATIRRLDLAPDLASVPAFIAPFRAAMGLCDFTLHLAGATGVFKSELAALMNQHFGPGIDGRHLPGSWHGTDNALEGLAFTAKDAVFVIDDFAPTGPPHEILRLHQKADRIIRHQGNNNSRQRMRHDGSLRPPKPPRGLIVSTGEDVPRGQSLRARMFIVEVNQGDIDTQKLSECQADAANGLYTAAMAAFVRWLAVRYEQVRTTLKAQIAEFRQKATVSGMHRRTPDTVASNAVGLKYFLDFAQESGAIDKNQAEALWQRCWTALGQVAAKQDAYHKASEPTRRFFELLVSAILSGHAHLADAEGNAPAGSPEAWGWRLKTVGNGSEWQPQGDRVGWIDGVTTYLEPDASYGAAQKMAPGGADGLTITAQTLRKRLAESGRLVVDKSRGVNTVRKTLQGEQRNVMQLTDGVLAPEKPGTPDISAGPSLGEWQECRVCQVSPEVDPQDRQVEIEERAAILEFDGGLPREQAEAEATRLTQEH